MKLPSSKFWFICYDKGPKLYWYGSYDYESLLYAWSKAKFAISDLNFQNISPEELAGSPPDHLFKQFPLVIACTHPFDYTFLQTYYPEYLI